MDGSMKSYYLPYLLIPLSGIIIYGCSMHRQSYEPAPKPRIEDADTNTIICRHSSQPLLSIRDRLEERFK